MVIIIDGYNLLKTAIKPHHVDERERNAFIAQLVTYIRAIGNRIVVVFDGGQDSRPVSIQRHGVTIIYSGYKESADTVIKHLLGEYAVREMLLVSTDRELNRYAEQLDIPSMDSTVFYSYMRNRLSERPSLRKPQQSSIQKWSHGEVDETELDLLMQEGSRSMVHKHEDRPSGEEKRSGKKSKIDKRLEKLVKKL